jgi:hypothetical protein
MTPVETPSLKDFTDASKSTLNVLAPVVNPPLHVITVAGESTMQDTTASEKTADDSVKTIDYSLTQTEKNVIINEVEKSALKVFGNSTIHGVVQAINGEELWKKVLWSISIISAFIMFFLVAKMNLETYHAYPVTTTTRFVNEKEASFPAVAVCNTNPFTTEKSVDFLTEYIENTTDTKYNATNQSKINFVNNHFFQTGYNQSFEYEASNYVFFHQTDEQKKSFGLPIEQMLINCQFNGVQCHAANWTWMYTLWNGNCFVFNKENTNKVKSINKENGLTVEIFTGHEDLIPAYQKSSGFQIFIFNHSKNLESSLDQFIPRYSVRPGTEINLEIKRKFIKKMPSPYSECEVDDKSTIDSWNSKLYRELVQTGKKYEQYNCYYRAFREVVVEKCKCAIKDGDVKEKVKICLSKEELDCRRNLDSTYFQTRRFDGRFDADCPLECDTEELEMRASLENFPTNYYGQYLLQNNLNFNRSYVNLKNVTFDLNYIKRSVTRIHFYYSKIGHELLVEVESMSVISLLANTGGMMGLFVGMSLLSMIEIVHVLIDTSLLLCKNY